jgi:hypothetical protein
LQYRIRVKVTPCSRNQCLCFGIHPVFGYQTFAY